MSVDNTVSLVLGRGQVHAIIDQLPADSIFISVLGQALAYYDATPESDEPTVEVLRWEAGMHEGEKVQADKFDVDKDGTLFLRDASSAVVAIYPSGSWVRASKAGVVTNGGRPKEATPDGSTDASPTES